MLFRSGLSQLKLQSLNIQDLYKQCLTLEQQIADDFNSTINTATQKITAHNDAAVKKSESCILNFQEQIKDGNNAIVEQLNCTYDKVNTIIEQNKKLVLQLSKESQSIAQQINEIGNYIARVEDKIIKGQALTRLECQAITTQLNSLHNELTKSVAQTKDELLKVENTNYQELRKSVMQLDKKTGTSISYSKAEIVLLALVIILMITLFS